MRKCDSCGSLLLGDVDTCARCGAALTTPPASAAWPPAPGPAGPAPTAPPTPGMGRLSIPSPIPPPPPPTDSADAAAEFQQSWQPVMVGAPVSAKRSTPWGQVVVGVAVALVVALAVLHLNSGNNLPAGTSDFVSGGGVTYTSPDGSFQMQSPTPPIVASRPMTIGSVQTTAYISTATTDDYAIIGGSAVVPVNVPRDRINDALNAMANAGSTSLKATISHQSLTTHGVLPAIEESLNTPDGFKAKLLVVISGSAIIVLIVAAKSGVDRLFKALDDSLIIR
jgi:hypothetical protein